MMIITLQVIIQMSFQAMVTTNQWAWCRSMRRLPNALSPVRTTNSATILIFPTHSVQMTCLRLRSTLIIWTRTAPIPVTVWKFT